MSDSPINKPFKEAIEFFNQKLVLPTRSSKDVQAAEHDRALIVSGLMRTEMLQDVQGLLNQVMTEGMTLNEFAKKFRQHGERIGWYPKEGYARRARVVYETNIRQAYNAGRKKQAEDPDFKRAFPYMEYRHSGAERYRPEHKSWNGLVLRSDDPWWETHSPSNGYFCRCRKLPVSERQLKKMGKTAPDSAPAIEHYRVVDKRTGEEQSVPKGISPGFQYEPGAGWLKSVSLAPGELPDTIPAVSVATDLMPEPRVVEASMVLDDGLSDGDYAAAFLKEFGASIDNPMVFEDVLSEPLLISERLMQRHDGKWKINKDGLRHRYLKLLARTIADPDEIWVMMEPLRKKPGQYVLKRRYLARWELEINGEQLHAFSAFEWQGGMWQGRTIFTPKDTETGLPINQAYMDQQRAGVRVFKRKMSEFEGG